MAWLYLIVAALFEICWPVGLKLAQTEAHRISGIAMALAGMALSGLLLYLAQREIPIGTAYAIWTGIGAAGTFAIGVWFFGDTASVARYLGVLLIIGGVVVLKVAQ
ncbi:MAG: multidrug efflux SMR transporter [Betaproteobacteria bacterium]